MCLSRKPAQIMVFQITNSMQPFRLPALQNYEYISTIGEGTYGVVWKCRDKVSGRLVAVKAFKEAHRDRVALKLAVREAKVLSMIKHPNIVKMTASYRSKSGRLYLVLEYIETSLHSHLKRFPCGLPAVLTKILCWQLLYAVAYLHEDKILHRDIKPDNILVTNKGVLKLCDFGFARHTFCEPRNVQHCTQYITTRWYRSPDYLATGYEPRQRVPRSLASFAHLLVLIFAIIGLHNGEG
ncbi:hypothetical protein Vretimale_18791 [Volvox reticuliferus]|uniref:cyclin-dependent kinase n=1 Tax=Volvox reticuliferus TaxID=1737510 RepID=A0A8J4GVP9_9CHLO|nr:hypothetical protein Vretimale_18791 [Volvox reticuliferus]